MAILEANGTVVEFPEPPNSGEEAPETITKEAL